MIKILIPLKHEELHYEGVWVKEVSPVTGIINNLPVFSKEYKFGDTIEFDPDTQKAIRVIQDGGYAPTEVIQYRGRFTGEKAKWQGKGYEVEGIGRGRLAITRRLRQELSP